MPSLSRFEINYPNSDSVSIFNYIIIDINNNIINFLIVIYIFIYNLIYRNAHFLCDCVKKRRGNTRITV